LVETHQRVKFVELSGNTPDKLAIASFGRSGSGKTRFICTMPGKVGVIPLDRKSRRTIERASAEMGLKKGHIIMPATDFVRLENPMKLAMMGNDEAMAFYRSHVNRIKDAIYTLAEMSGVESICIDSATQLSEDTLFACYGRDQKIMPRDRGLYNGELKNLLASIQHRQVLLTHEARSIWKNDKPTARDEMTGWSKMEYNTNLMVEHSRTVLTGDYNLTIRQSQDRPDLIGEALVNDDITFPMLATMLYPDGDWF
jgi:hypothetical protein